jgi:hypothetical protein
MFENYTLEKKIKTCFKFVFLTKKFLKKKNIITFLKLFKNVMKGISKKFVKHSCPIKIQSLYNLVNVLRNF